MATLGKIYASDAPAFGSRSWKLVIPGRPTGGPFGPQQLVYNDEYVATELGQIGTQFDGPGHIGVITSKGMFYYNGRFLHDKGVELGGHGAARRRARGAEGLRVPRRAARCGRPARRPAAGARRRTAPAIPASSPPRTWRRWSSARASPPSAPGDCVFLHTGHGDIWHPKNWDTYDAAEKKKRVAQFNAGEPGFGISACEYLAERKIILTGADTWAVEAVGKGAGGENPQPFECHIKLQTKRGIWNLENMDLSQLVADRAYEFLFVWSPLKMKGATGSPGNPVALY